MSAAHRILSTHRLGATTALYLQDRASGQVGLTLVPTAMRRAQVARREAVRGVEVDGFAASLGQSIAAWKVESLAQVHAADDNLPAAYSHGSTFRNSGSVDQLAYTGQRVIRKSKAISIRTRFRHRVRNWILQHTLTWRRGTAWLDSQVNVINRSRHPLELEMLASFSLSGITPFARDDAPGRLHLHRWRSVWSMEARRQSTPFEELQLERSWVGWGVRCERFGSVGSLPTKHFFPQAVVEDSRAGVCWGVQLAQPGSWQIEAYRRDDTASLSGGLADADFGHWRKVIAPGGSFTTPTARLVCLAGSVEQACAALTRSHEPALKDQPADEAKLPVIFNEWATSWGRPTQSEMTALAQRLAGLGVKYLVIDAGWYAPPGGGWSSSHGDWQVNRELFPDGLAAAAKSIRAAGFVPGLWFEFETVGVKSRAFQNTRMLLKRDGRVLTVGKRRFLDLRKPEVIAHLANRVIATLRTGGFGYLKIDYNESLGRGVDGAESVGEGLRQQLAAVQSFIARIRRELPSLVIENCASGGHRLEPSMMGLTAMSSATDAHECQELPIIAANLHDVILPRQSQIWAVIRSDESLTRTLYSLAAGFLGRLCLSGDAPRWREDQMQLVRQALALYRRAASLIRQGETQRFGPKVAAYRHAEGWQSVLRLSANRGSALIVMHAFAQSAGLKTVTPLPPGRWKLTGQLLANPASVTLSGGAVRWRINQPWSAGILLLKRA